MGVTNDAKKMLGKVQHYIELISSRMAEADRKIVKLKQMPDILSDDFR